jgi:uncharacterized protein (DUF983 family)
MDAMQRPPAGTLILRALRLKCPRCGQASMFAGLFRMHERCTHCGLKYEREPGYFLGSIYINYGVAALLLTVGWITLRFGYGIESRWLVFGFAAVLVVFQLFFFRFARALWLALDCQFDASLFADSPGNLPSGLSLKKVSGTLPQVDNAIPDHNPKVADTFFSQSPPGEVDDERR